MRLPVRLTRYAVEDLLAIGEWYQSKRLGLISNS